MATLGRVLGPAFLERGDGGDMESHHPGIESRQKKGGAGQGFCNHGGGQIKNSHRGPSFIIELCFFFF